MKKILYILPFIVTAAIFFAIHKPEKPKVVVAKEESVIAVQNTLFDKWYESTRDLTKNDFFETFKIKTIEKTLKFPEMDETKKSLFRILYCSKIKKELNAFNQDTLSEKQKEKLLSIKTFCDEELDKNKKKIYNIYGDKMHQFDKNFLDKLDVYIFN